ncbi:dephospho-CoA kinase [Catenovulum maritimum]|uniref:Dephospho-CoA kinase n=1 Tax=Catenovulum maritimum TaxID=1513271 RepID=A0A0J8GTN5_9ALTE|nr:dephospho-CoA kinase [Catenovulum maritimum]KMT66125.1 dephospho-CoA kinase [Catenovulum maritimum]
MSELIIGLTGGIGSGKTTVSNIFKQFEIEVIDADIIAREVVEPGMPAYQEILARYGESILNKDSNLDRTKLRKIVFDDEKEKLWLNQLTHPQIRNQLKLQSQHAKSPYCLLSIPLLLENQLEYLVDRILVIDCEEETQITRAATRDNSTPEQISKIMNAQINRKSRLAAADEVINTDVSFELVSQKCADLHQFYLILAKSSPLS